MNQQKSVFVCERKMELNLKKWKENFTFWQDTFLVRHFSSSVCLVGCDEQQKKVAFFVSCEMTTQTKDKISAKNKQTLEEKKKKKKKNFVELNF